MTTDEVVARARSAIGHGTIYELGRGGMDPASRWPWDPESRCDCSGTVMWALGRSRLYLGVWFGTDRIHADALGPTSGPDIFGTVPLAECRPSDLLVWKGFNGHHGHVGVVASIGVSGPETIVHCSSGNWRRTKDAIAETGVAMFIANYAIIARCSMIQAA